MSVVDRPAPPTARPVVTASGATGLILIVALLGAGVALVDTSQLGTAVAIMVVGVVLIAGYAVLSSRQKLDWLHPLGFPMLYLALTLVAPFVYTYATGRRLGILLRPGVLTPALAYALLLAFASLVVGIILGLNRPAPDERADRRSVDYVTLRRIGLAILVAVAVSQLYLRWRVNVVDFADRQTDYGVDLFLDRATRAALAPATLLVGISGVALKGRVLAGWGGFMIVAAGITLLLSGFRGTPLGQLVLVVAMYQALVGRIPLKKLVIVTGTALLLLVTVNTARQGQQILPTGGGELLNRTLAPFNAPASNTGVLMALMDEGEEFRRGATYVEAIKFLPPGPLARLMFGSPENTGAAVFGRLVGERAGSAGVGFTYIGEAWLNFGWPGIAVAMLLLGYALGWTATRLNPAATRPRHVAYLLLVALLPFQFRADSLAQLKTAVTVAVIVSFAYAAATRLTPATAPPDAPLGGGLRVPVRQGRWLPARTSAEGG